MQVQRVVKSLNSHTPQQYHRKRITQGVVSDKNYESDCSVECEDEDRNEAAQKGRRLYKFYLTQEDPRTI